MAALVLSIRPSLTATGVRGILEATCDPVPGVTFDDQGHNVAYGHGRINALRAVQVSATRVLDGPKP